MQTQSTLTLVGGGLVIALVSATVGVAGAFFYLFQPLQKGQVEYSEKYLPNQVDALKALRAGQADKAVAYLEMATTFSLLSMGEQRDQGAKVPGSPEAAAAVQYLCDQPPTAAASKATAKLTFGEACALLTRR